MVNNTNTMEKKTSRKIFGHLHIRGFNNRLTRVRTTARYRVGAVQKFVLVHNVHRIVIRHYLDYMCVLCIFTVFVLDVWAHNATFNQQNSNVGSVAKKKTTQHVERNASWERLGLDERVEMHQLTYFTQRLRKFGIEKVRTTCAYELGLYSSTSPLYGSDYFEL